MPSPLRDRERVTAALAGSASISEVLRRLGLSAASGNYIGFHAACARFGLKPPDVTAAHVATLAPFRKVARPLAEILVENSPHQSRADIKKRLIGLKLLDERCYVCQLGPWWNGARLSLQLDHKNGVRNDNRLENLRLLCPNCHSQTPTFSGKARRARAKERITCPKCGSKKTTTSGACRTCAGRARRGRFTKASWPADAELLAEVRGTSYSAAARRLGVSPTAVHNRVKRIVREAGLEPAV